MKRSIKISLLICFILTFIFSIISVNRALAKVDIFKLDNISISDKSDDVEAKIDSFDKSNVKTDITYHKINDYVVYKLTIKNNDSKDYTIKSIVNSNINNNISYEYDTYENEIIKSNSTKDIYIKTIYKNKLTDISKRDTNNEVKLVFTFIDDKGNEVEKDIKVNPNTYDYIGIYITLGIVSIIAIILLIVLKKKNSKKALLMFISILFIPVITKALTDSYTITFNSTNKIYDRLVVTYDDNEKVIDYNTKLDKPNDPTKEGYEFLGWYVGDNEYNFDSLVKEDIKIESKWKATEYTISYEDSNADNPVKYTIEDEITLKNPTKEGYSFSGWTGSNGTSYQTRVTIEKGSTGNKSYKANFSPNQDTQYKVIHRYPNLDGTYEEVEENLTGTTDTEVTPALLPKEGFTGPSLQTVTINSDGTTKVTYTYTRKEYRLILNNDIETTFTNSTYPYETEITLTAKDKDNYEFTKWSNGETTKTIKFNITEDTEIYPEYTKKRYKVRYNANGGNFYNISLLTNDVTYTLNETTNKYETEDTYKNPTKTDNAFKGWYTDSNCTDGNEFDINTVTLDSDIEVYAKWQEGTAMFIAGPTFNEKIKNKSTSFERSATIPEKYINDTYLVSTSDSGIPIYMWYEEDTKATKWYSDVTKAYLNPDSSNMFYLKSMLESIDTLGFDTSNVTNMSGMFGLCESLKYVDVSNFDTSKVTNMSEMFSSCINLEELNVSNFDTSNVTNMKAMFVNLASLNTLNVNNFDTSKVTNMSAMFERCASLEEIDVSNFDTSNVTSMSYMFDMRPFERYNITDNKLKRIIFSNKFDTSKVTSMSYMFAYDKYLSTLDVSNFDTSNVTDMSYMFAHDKYLSTLDVSIFDTSNVTDMSYMFIACSSLNEIDLSNFNTSKVTSMISMFQSCTNLETIKVSDSFVTNAVTNSNYMFTYDTSLVGGRGTVYDANHIDKEYAHIDGGTSKPGYFTSNITSYTVSFNTDGGSSIEEQVVNDGEKATRPTTNPTKDGYNFINWYTDSNYSTLFDFDNTTITSDTTIYAKFKKETFPTVFSQEGECTFNGSSGVITGENCKYANGVNKYIDTGINLYNSENHDKDYEIGLTIVSYNSSEQVKQATFMNTKSEGDNYPGLVFRRKDLETGFDISSRKTSGANERVLFNSGTVDKVKIFRITNEDTGVQEIFYSINDGEKIKLNDLSKYNPEFDLSVWFGAAPTNASATSAQRILVNTTLKDMYIKLGTYSEDNTEKYTVSYNANGGSVTPTSTRVVQGSSIATLPTPTAPEGKVFDNWYTGLTDGEVVTSSYTPNSDVTIYARYTDIKYTVTFNTDSDTYIPSQKVTYGDKVTRPSTIPTKEDYVFVDWYTNNRSYSTNFDFDNTTLTKNITLYAKYDSDDCGTFRTDSWSTIKSNLENDPSYYAIGCEKQIELDMDNDGNNELYTVRIANTSTPEICNTYGYSQTACGTVIEFADIVTSHVMNSTYSNAGGWIESEMITWLNNDFYDKLPNDLKNIIIPTYPIVSGSGLGQSSDNVTINDSSKNKIYLLSPVEIGTDAGEWDNKIDPLLDTRTLDCYIDSNKRYNNGYKSNIDGNSSRWWLRTARALDSDAFLYNMMSGGGGVLANGAYSRFGVSPAFRISKNTYTITYNANSGSVSNPTKELIKGSTIGTLPTPTAPTGKEFDGWYTGLTTGIKVTSSYTPNSNVTIYARYKDNPCKTFATDSWTTIRDNLENDSSYYAVGCEKEVELDMDNNGTNESYTVRLANTSNTGGCSSTGFSQTACGTVIEFVDIATTHVMNPTDTNAGGWKETEMVTYLNSDFYNKLPNDIKSLIIPTYPIVSSSGKTGVSADITATDTDKNKIYLLSSREIGVERDWDNKNDVTTDTRTLDYYDLNNNNESRIKYNLDGLSKYWWTRSASNTTNSSFISVITTGNPTVNPATDTTKGIAPAFRIGTMPEFTVSFDTDGGSSVADQTINYGEKVTKPSTNPTKEGYIFDNWYTDDTYTTVFDFENTTITSDTTIYANFRNKLVSSNNIGKTVFSQNNCSRNVNITINEDTVCKRAIKLHTEICPSGSSSGYCNGKYGNSRETEITYGNCGTIGTLKDGDAFTCDVNGDSIFDEESERFYYLGNYYDPDTNSYNSDIGVLIYYNNVIDGIADNSTGKRYHSTSSNYYGPTELVSNLPTVNQWSNVSLVNSNRQILNENIYMIYGEQKKLAFNKNLPIFDYSGYAARFVTVDEMVTACGIMNSSVGELDDCNYVFENTAYTNSSLLMGVWTETPRSGNTSDVWAIFPYDRDLYHVSAQNPSQFGARPVIEVPKTKISY